MAKPIPHNILIPACRVCGQRLDPPAIVFSDDRDDIEMNETCDGCHGWQHLECFALLVNGGHSWAPDIRHSDTAALRRRGM